MSSAEATGMLSPYRVLDLTDERGILCGKILADLGADVIQVEPPEGSSARRVGPFFHDEPHPERSLFWWAYATNKRSITLNLARRDGKSLLTRLIQSAHFLVESFPPGHMARLGLDYSALAALNPALIVISITPYGQDGPYAHHQTSDLNGMGMAGFMYLTGDPDRPPVRVGVPHFYLHGAAAGATGAMIAHAQRVLTGQGQHVDVSCQEAVARTLASAPQLFALENTVIRRQGSYRQTGGTTFMRITWPCQDGFVNFQLSGGAGAGRSVNNLIQWMDEEGLGDPCLTELDWTTFGYGMITRELLERVVPPVERFLMSHTKAELFEGAVKRRILLFPVSTTADIVQNTQLQARDYFREMTHPDLEIPITYPGPFVQASATSINLRRFAPKLGEHNAAIYLDDLGLTREELVRLYESGAI
jgi:crotonobetainyl-CoA:carnitine CoA-transferase CaiB-like acyl-CoA transferase